MREKSPATAQSPRFSYKHGPSPRNSPSLRAESEDSSLSIPYIPSSDTTCIIAESIPESVYDGESDSQPGVIHLSEYRPEDEDPVEVPIVISTHASPKPKPAPITSDATQVVAYQPSALRMIKVDHVPHGPPQGLVSVRRNRYPLGRCTSLDSNQSISIISSFPPPTIPPEPRIPLSFLGKENLQVQFSETDATDLDMGLCVLGSESSTSTHPYILAGCGHCLD